MAKRSFAVIGLGRFGAAMATTLAELGHDVIGVDGSADRVRALADTLTLAVELDATDERALEKDQDSVGDITLKKGTNVLVVKVVNTIVDWSGCVRFVDKDGKPVTGLKVRLTK